MIIYADSLFLVNFFMDSVLLYICSVSLRRAPDPLKLLLGAAFLSICGTVIFFFDLNIIISSVLKIFSLIIGVILSFGKERIIKSIAMFLVISFLSGGVIFALTYRSNFGITMNTSVSNGTLYMDINPLILIAGCCIIYIFAWFLRRIYIKNFSRERLMEKIRFIYNQKEYIINCLVDTGCSLTEPLSGEPLMIIDKGIVQVDNGAEIVINTVNGKSRMKLIFPESIEAINKNVVINKNIPIGISNCKINSDGIYNGLLNPDAILNDGKEEKLCQVL